MRQCGGRRGRGILKRDVILFAQLEFVKLLKVLSKAELCTFKVFPLVFSLHPSCWRAVLFETRNDCMQCNLMIMDPHLSEETLNYSNRSETA